MASIAVIGELNLDLIVVGAQRMPRPGEELIVDRMELTLGSSSAITACQLARLGNDVLFISKVGDDDFGRRALEFLREKGVSTESIIVEESLATGLTISATLGTERAMLTVMGCIKELRYEDIDFGLLRSRQHLHISSFYLQRSLRPDVARIFAEAKEMGLTTSLDTGWPHEGESIRDPDPERGGGRASLRESGPRRRAGLLRRARAHRCGQAGSRRCHREEGRRDRAARGIRGRRGRYHRRRRLLQRRIPARLPGRHGPGRMC